MKYIKLYESFVNENRSNINSNFYKWFGNSKVVDNNGNPLICYHGSYSDFSIFKPSKSVGTHNENNQIEGIYFTSSYEAASFFALADDARFIKSVYLSFQNSYISKTHNSLKEEIGIDENYLVCEKLKSLGYDSLILEKGFQTLGTHTLYLAFYPNQIKSINNDGSWDIEDNNIYS